jgi:hypothetical protein
MGLAGFPNTSASPQQGQFHGGGLAAAGAAGLAQQVRYACLLGMLLVCCLVVVGVCCQLPVVAAARASMEVGWQLQESRPGAAGTMIICL